METGREGREEGDREATPTLSTNSVRSMNEQLESDPSIPSTVAGEGPHPTGHRVGASSSLRTQAWTATAGNWAHWPRGEFVVAKEEIGVSRNPNLVALTDLSSAFARGRSCRHYRIKTPDHHRQDRPPSERPEGFILEMGSVAEAFAWLESRTDEEFAGDEYSDFLDYEGAEGTRYRIYRETQKGVRTFSALHLDQVTPLSSIPKTWNVRRAMRAILSGQVQRWHIDGVFTDDYALDNARNFCRGQLEDYLGKARRIWERPSGWRVYPENEASTELSLNCHQFDNNTVTIDLDAEAFEVGRLTCLRWAEEHPADFFHEDPGEFTQPA
jgi:hypothetical protein